jgi:F-type H+-transporting ATPase subunit a
MPKKRVFGCSLPLLIGIALVAIFLFIFGVISGPIGQRIIGHEIGPSWLHVETPEPTLAPGVLFNIGSFPVTNTMITAWITIIVVFLLTFFAFRRPKLVPSGLQKVMEYIYTTLLDFCVSVAGEKNGRRFFPFVATIFLFVIVNAYMGLLPFYGDAFFIINSSGQHVPLLRAANTDINVPLALALFSWISIETFGIRAHRFVPYIGKFLNFRRLWKGLGSLFRGKLKEAFVDIAYGAIDVFVGILEAISEFIRIVSFTFRLFGNMTAGEVLILIVAFLSPFITGFLVYGLETLVGFVQALIFGGLTLVWMTTAVEKHAEEEHA